MLAKLEHSFYEPPREKERYRVNNRDPIRLTFEWLCNFSVVLCNFRSSCPVRTDKHNRISEHTILRKFLDDGDTTGERERVVNLVGFYCYWGPFWLSNEVSLLWHGKCCRLVGHQKRNMAFGFTRIYIQIFFFNLTINYIIIMLTVFLYRN